MLEILSKQICSAERMIRLKRQQTEVKGVIIDSQTELFHGLTVKIQSMVDENKLSYIGPEKCKEQEIQKDKAETVLASNILSYDLERATINIVTLEMHETARLKNEARRQCISMAQSLRDELLTLNKLQPLRR